MPSRHLYTPEQCAEAIEFVKNGMSYTAAGKQTGFAASTVEKWCKSAGVESLHLRGRLRKQYRQSAKTTALREYDLYGASLTCRHTGVPRTTLQRWVKEREEQNEK